MSGKINHTYCHVCQQDLDFAEDAETARCIYGCGSVFKVERRGEFRPELTLVRVTPEFICDYIKSHPGCILSLFAEVDHDVVDEDQLLNPADWQDTTEEAGLVYWENQNVDFVDGIRFCLEGGVITFEDC